MTCAGFYHVYRGRCYENNDILPKMGASRPTLCSGDLRSVGGTVGIMPIAAAAAWAATVTSQACRYLIGKMQVADLSGLKAGCSLQLMHATATCRSSH